jgi:hypothetical protein
MGDVYGHFFYRRRTGQILEEAVAYSQDLCGNDVICHRRHQGLVEARNIYRLPSIALREVMAGARIDTVTPIISAPRGEKGSR